MSTTPKKRLLTDFFYNPSRHLPAQTAHDVLLRSPLRTPLDEMSTIATGAYAVGLD